MFEVAVGILQEGFQMGGHVMGSVNETVVPLADLAFDVDGTVVVLHDVVGS